MNQKLKIFVLFIITLGLLGIGVYILFYFHQTEKKLSVEQAEILSQQKVLMDTMARLDSKCESIQMSLKQLETSNQDFQHGMDAVKKEQEHIKIQVEDVSKKLDALDASTQTKLKSLTFSLEAVEGRANGWVKDNLSTMTVFEDTLNSNSKELEVLLKFRLPEIDKIIASLKQRQQGSPSKEDLKTQNISVLEEKVDALDQQVKAIQEKTLDVILKEK